MIEVFWNETEPNEHRPELEYTMSNIRYREGVLKRVYEEPWWVLDKCFWYNTALIPNHFKEINSRMSEKFKDIDSSTASLLNNSQIQIFLSRLISNYENDWNKNSLKITSINNKQINIQPAGNEWANSDDTEEHDLNKSNYETWEEYKAHSSTPVGFEEFLLSDEWIWILKNEIGTHIDENWNVYENFGFSETNLKIKLIQAWHNSMYRDYNRKFNVITSDNIIEASRIWNIVTNVIDSTVWNHLKLWWTKFDESLVEWIESWLTKETNNAYIMKINEDQELKDIFYEFLKENIKKYYSLIIKNNDIKLNTWDKLVDLQLRCYLYIYGKFFYPDMVKPGQSELYYENNLSRIMKAILVFDGKIKDMEDKELLERQRKDAQERKRREEERRKRYEEALRKKNRESNNQKRVPNQKPEFVKPLEGKSVDLANATWAEIAANANLRLDTDNYNIDIDKSENKNLWLKGTAFNVARDDFINLHNNISEIINKRQMFRIFDFKNNDINIIEWENFKNNNPILEKASDGYINQIYSTLSSFSSILNDTIVKLSDKSSDKKSEITKTVKNYAIGSVIDNVRYTFSEISKKQGWNSKWFELNGKEPIIREWNNIKILWSFNGSDVRINYNLDSWELFINSFFNRLEPGKISIWDNILVPVWKIKPFNEIINDQYENYKPTHIRKKVDSTSSTRVWITKQNSDVGHMYHQRQDNWPSNTKWANTSEQPKSIENLLFSQMSLIESVVKDRLEKQAVQNSTIKQFMKTFNIIPDAWEIWTLHFNKTSNLFAFLEIIETTGEDQKDGIQTLEYFNNEFMPIFMKYSWLEWWKNNEKQDKLNEYSKNVFNNPNPNNDIQDLIDTMKQFKPDQFSGTHNFDTDYQLSFVNLITRRFLDSSKTKLNIDGMKEFITSIITNISDKSNNKEKTE